MAGLEGIQQQHRQLPPHAGVGTDESRPRTRSRTWIEEASVRAALELCGDPSRGEVCLPSRPESAATARRLTESVVRTSWGLGPQLSEQAVLLVSELVGNAVRHTGARTFGLRMLRRQGWIRIEVRDPSRGLPCLMPVRPMDISGRGLFLIDKLADRWGVDLLPRGKATWFEMRIRERG